MTNLKNNILNKIKKGEIKKTSSFYFLGKKYIFWSLFVFSLFSGAIAFSILLKNTFDDFGPWYKLEMPEKFLLSNIFLIWAILIILFIISSIFYFKKTKNGFKYKNIYLILTSLLLSSLLGFIFYKIHLGHFIEHNFEKHNKRYYQIKKEKHQKILKYLKENNINEKDFFQNSKILKLKEKYDKIDNERIEKIKKILENNKNLDNIDEIKILFEKIKLKKREIDYKRLMFLIEEYKKE